MVNLFGANKMKETDSLSEIHQFIKNEYPFYRWLELASGYEEKGEKIPRVLRLRLRNLAEELGIDIPNCPIKDVL